MKGLLAKSLFLRAKTFFVAPEACSSPPLADSARCNSKNRFNDLFEEISVLATAREDVTKGQ